MGMSPFELRRSTIVAATAPALNRPATPPLRPRARLVFALAAAMLAIPPAIGLAQPVDGAGGRAAPPARIDNHYNHKAYQPTTGAVCDRAGSDSIDCATRAGKDAAAKLENVQRQLDGLAKEYPPEPPTGSPDGRR